MAKKNIDQLLKTTKNISPNRTVMHQQQQAASIMFYQHQQQQLMCKQSGIFGGVGFQQQLLNHTTKLNSFQGDERQMKRNMIHFKPY